MLVRVDEYATLWKLNTRQHQHLQLAAAGAVTRTVSEWRSATMENMHANADGLRQMAEDREIALAQANAVNQLRQMQGLAIPSPGISLAVPVNAESLDLTHVQNHPVWKRAVARLRREIDISGVERTAWGVNSCVDFVLTALNRELWLRDDQLLSMRRLVAGVMPGDIDQVSQPGRELLYVAIILKKVSPESLGTVLDAAQMDAWQELANQFDYREDSVQISLRDGSVFVLEYAW